MTWVLNSAPDLPAELLGTLISLADHADARGRYAYPSAATLARQARKSHRQVQRDLARLEELGLIRRGDQSRVARMAPRHRPVVYDLPVSDTTSVTYLDTTSVSYRDTTSRALRYDTGDASDTTPMSYKPSLNRPRENQGRKGKPEPAFEDEDPPEFWYIGQMP